MSAHSQPLSDAPAQVAQRRYAGLLMRLGALALFALVFWLGLAPLRAVPDVVPAGATPLVVPNPGGGNGEASCI